ncbi:MAG TPA: FG-GAP-like repeat-containing protein [Anaerolineae bacterium]|nr:FG-GAP-like repeat-containing protein [Anaerolineae bacterium]
MTTRHAVRSATQRNSPSRRIDPRPLRLLIVLVLNSIGLALLLASVSQTLLAHSLAAPPLRPLLAPQPSGVAPARNALSVSLGSDISITFDEPISLTAVTSRTFALYGRQSPIFTGAYSLSNFSRTLTLDPARTFFPGEVIEAVVTTGTLNITGEQLITPTVWQFWAAAIGGTGRFIAHSTTPSFGAGDSTDVALGDIDGDGDLDALVANYFPGEAETVWLNDGAGNFTPHPTTSSFGAGNSTGIGLGDIDGDGDLDALVANYNGQAETAWLNDGAGNFTPHPTTPSFGAGDSQGVALGDVDGDGDLDALVANYSGQAETTWLNDGAGNFTPHPTTPTFGGDSSTAVTLGDIDGDGDLDAVVANHFDQPETAWLNDGAGNFAAHPAIPSFGLGDSLDVEMGDVDGDGDLDALIANEGIEAETVWLNQDRFADLVITKTASPEPAVAGTSLFYTITIANQGTITATSVVLSDTLPPSTTLTTVDQTDDDNDPFGFGGGAGQDTQWYDPRPAVGGDEWLGLANLLTPTGVFTSRVIDAGNVVSWTSLAWSPVRPTWKPLPNNRGAETAYPLGDANMTGNRALLHLDENAGAITFTNASGVGNPGTCPAAAGEACPMAGSVGRFNQALSFDGALSQTVVISDGVDPVRYAIEAWVYPTVITDTSFILRTDALSGTSTNFSHLLGLSGDRFLHLVNDGSSQAITGTTVVNAGQWYHVAGTAESNGDIKLYVNGALEATLNNIGPLWTGGDQYRLGSAYGPTGTTQYFSGLLDEVAIYTRTLSAGEVLDHYLRGALRLSLQARSCDDAACDTETFGPTYTEQANTGLGLPAVALTNTPDNRYFQYRVTFETDDPVYSPGLRRVTVGPAHRAIHASQGNCAAPVPDAFGCDLGDLGSGGLVTLTTEAFIDPSALGVITNTATITTASLDTDPLTNADDVTTTVVSEVRLSIDKYDDDRDLPRGTPISPGSADPVNPGSPLTYTLAVYNGGPSTAWAVTVTDSLPIPIAGAAAPASWNCQYLGQAITCTTPSLAVYSTQYILITGTVPASQGVITNTTWVTSTGSTVYTSTSQLSDTITTTITSLADLVIDKFAYPDPVDPGGVLTFTVVITNSGPYTATNVIVTDTLQAGLIGFPLPNPRWACGAPGNTIICTLLTPLTPTFSARFDITVTAPLSGLIANTARVTSNVFDPDDNDNSVTAYAAVRPVADLSIDKRDTPDPVDAGAPLTYTLTVTNAGPVAAGALTTTLSVTQTRNIDIPWSGRAGPYPSTLRLSSVPGAIRDLSVTLNDFSHTYPADVDVLLVGPGGQTAVLMANAGGGTDAANLTLTFNDAGAPLPLTDTLTSTLAYRPTSYGLSGDFATPAPGGPYGGSLSAFDGISPNGDWSLYVYDHFDSDEGSIAGWGLHITALTTDSVTLSDTLPNGLTGVAVDMPSGWLCSAGANPLTCTADRIEIGLPTVFTLTATAPITGGVITNTAHITSTTADLNPAFNTATITTTVMALADLGIVKTTNAAQVGAGNPLTYTLTISNAGPSAIGTTVVVTDVLPPGLGSASASGSGWSCNTSALPTITCTLNSLAVGPAPNIVIAATAPITLGVITNTAWITSTVNDPSLLNNSAFVTVTVGEVPITGLLAFNSSPTTLGRSTAFTATIAGGSNVTYTWNFGDGTSVRAGNPVSHTYALSGTYTAVVTATNSLGSVTATTTVLITNLRPIANAGPDQSVSVNAAVALDGSASTDPDGHLPLAYGWRQVGGAPVVLSSAIISRPAFTAPGAASVLTFSLTVTDAFGLASAPDLVVITVTPYRYLYLPVVMRNYATTPDLVVSSVAVTTNTVRVVIKNQGPEAVPVDTAHEFWVDLYVNPNPVPTAVNHIWSDGRSTQGIVWGVTVDALPQLQPGGVLTLTLGDRYTWPSLSNFLGGLAPGTPIYVQVDSAHAQTTYGGVLENHEIVGTPYNNIAGPAPSTASRTPD